MCKINIKHTSFQCKACQSKDDFLFNSEERRFSAKLKFVSYVQNTLTCSLHGKRIIVISTKHINLRLTIQANAIKNCSYYMYYQRISENVKT